jgi:hypothetical protein
MSSREFVTLVAGVALGSVLAQLLEAYLIRRGVYGKGPYG